MRLPLHHSYHTLPLVVVRVLTIELSLMTLLDSLQRPIVIQHEEYEKCTSARSSHNCRDLRGDRIDAVLRRIHVYEG